ncbi:Putative drug resistance transporter (plasmid) [Streptantibioticus cattleyicolor NRRL 8057 = DSM 46488]|nr:Putative drug resistance transporter [Streptantibioticus cattleyicolor NRRL 8057 = DSM 46488]
MLAGLLTLGAVMTQLDSTAVNVAFDSIRGDLHASLGGAQWAITGYLLAMAATVPLVGWAADRFGTKRLWICSVTLFVVGSALAGLSWSIGSLILFRVLQGMGGGLIVPVAQTIMAAAAGPHRLGRSMSLLGLTTLLGPILGPVLGGVLVQYADWHWIFYVNVPVGAVALAAAARLLPDRRAGERRPFDAVGMALISAGVTAVVLGLSEAAGPSGVRGAVTAGLGAGLLAAFVLHSLRRGPTALIDVRLFRHRCFSVASVFLFVVSTVLFGALLLVPLYYQVVRGQGALTSGLLLTPQAIGTAVVMPVAGRLTDRFGPRAAVLPGLVLAALGTLVYAHVTSRSPMTLLAGALVVRGFGIGLVMTPTTAASYVSLPGGALARAAGVTTILRQLGASVGTTVFALLLAGDLAHTRQAAAFRDTFRVVVALTGLLVVPAALMPGRPGTPGSTAPG